MSDDLYVTDARLQTWLAGRGYVAGKPIFTGVTNINTAFGAVGDNVTDDTAAFRAAFANTTGTLYIPTGTYKITDTLFLKNDLTIVGDGIGYTVINAALVSNGSQSDPVLGDRPLMSFAGSVSNYIQNCNFEGFTLDGANMIGFMANGSYGKGIYAVYMRNCVFRNLAIQNFPATGLGCDFMIGCEIAHVTVTGNGRRATSIASAHGCAGIGIGCYGDATTGGMFEDISIHDCKALSNYTYGIFVETQLADGPSTYGGRIYANVCKGNNAGIGACGMLFMTIFGNVVLQNTSINIAVNGGTYTPGQPSYQLIIANNMIGGMGTTSGNDGIVLDYTKFNATTLISGSVKVCDNYVVNCSRGINCFVGSNGVNGILLQNNFLDNNQQDGIKLQYASGVLTTVTANYVIIQGNTIRGAGNSGTPTSAITVQASTIRLSILDNVFANLKSPSTMTRCIGFSTAGTPAVSHKNVVIMNNNFDLQVAPTMGITNITNADPWTTNNTILTNNIGLDVQYPLIQLVPPT